MRRPRLLVLGSWVVATALATLISAAGVSIVTRDVTSDHGRALATADVVALLSAGAPAPSATDAPAAIETPPASASTDTAPPAPPETVATPPAPPSTASAAPPPPSATFATDGGVIAVACDGPRVSLLSARPDNGFQEQVRDWGPAWVVVAFAAAGANDAKIAAACPAGVPTLVDERPASPPGGLGVDSRDREADERDDHERDENDDDDGRSGPGGRENEDERPGGSRGR